MAHVEPTIRGQGDASVITWGPLAPGDTVAPVKLNGYGTVAGCLQVEGTFGGATARLEGSNDGTSYYDLNDLANVAIGLTAAGLVDFSSGALFVRPDIQGGVGYSITYILVARS